VGLLLRVALAKARLFRLAGQLERAPPWFDRAPVQSPDPATTVTASADSAGGN